MKRYLGLFVICATSLLLTFSQAHGQALAPFDGTWGGNTMFDVGDGKRESSRCTSTNTVSGNRISLKLRCGNASSPHLDVRATITESSGTLSGSWEERVYGQSGNVSGTISGTTLNAEVKNANVSARVSVQRSGNTLNVSVVPSEKRGRVNVAMSR